jgi:indolepyruvate ferredoxin oxidoreductase beta subunit
MYLAITLKTIDATKLAADAGSPQAMSVVMLGALAEHIPLREEELIEALSESVPAKFLEVNRRAFEFGKGGRLRIRPVSSI